MENWEFFLQKIGEDHWQKLEPTQPDVPSGRYVIAARAQHRSHEVMEVVVKTRPTRSAIAKQTKKQHSCRLDDEGFGILVREIELTPGIWEIHCQCDLLSELMGEDWGVTLSLTVTLQLEKAALKLREEIEETEAEDELEQLRSRLIADADQVLEEVINDLFADFEPPPQLANTEEANCDYSLQLDQDIFVAETNKPIILSGQVISHDQHSQENLRLKITLRDPRTGETVAQLSPYLPQSSFPLTFCYSLTVASNCHSYLLEGEIILCLGETSDNSPIFARQSFAVTANWEKLQPLLVSAITTAITSHPPAPLSPLSVNEGIFSSRFSQHKQGVFPPQLAVKGEKRKTTAPTLPKLHNQPQTEPKEYVWSKPDDSISRYEELTQT